MQDGRQPAQTSPGSGVPSPNTRMLHPTHGSPVGHGNSGSSQSQQMLVSAPTGSLPVGQNGGNRSGTNYAVGSSGSAHHVVSLNSPDAQNRNVYVASLPSNFSDDNLRDLFAPYGTIVSSKMFNNDGRPGSQGRAYGFVMFADEASVQRAIDALVGAVVGGQRIQVRRAKPTGRGPSSQPASQNATPHTSSTQQVLQPMAAVPAAANMGLQILNLVPQQLGGSITLQHIGMTPAGNPVYQTQNGQQVLLAAPTGASSPPPQHLAQQPQQQQNFMMVQQTLLPTNQQGQPIFMHAAPSGSGTTQPVAQGSAPLFFQQ